MLKLESGHLYKKCREVGMSNFGRVGFQAVFRNANGLKANGKEV